jgi:hypothetical protein
MALTTDQQAQLTAYQAAYAALISGKAVAAVDYNGERTQFVKADLNRLKVEIDALVALADTCPRPRGRAVRFRL